MRSLTTGSHQIPQGFSFLPIHKKIICWKSGTLISVNFTLGNLTNKRILRHLFQKGKQKTKMAWQVEAIAAHCEDLRLIPRPTQ